MWERIRFHRQHAGGRVGQRYILCNVSSLAATHASRRKTHMFSIHEPVLMRIAIREPSRKEAYESANATAPVRAATAAGRRGSACR